MSRGLAGILAQPLGGALHAEVANLAVPLVSRMSGRVGERIERGIERIDALEAQRAAIGEPQRVGDLAALEQLGEDAERRRPGADANRGAGLGKGLGDGETEAAVVRDTGDERAFSREIDVQHGPLVTSVWLRSPR
jgi:hypothetical protein